MKLIAVFVIQEKSVLITVLINAQSFKSHVLNLFSLLIRLFLDISINNSTLKAIRIPIEYFR